MAFKEGVVIGPSVLNGGTVQIGTDNASNAITIGTGTVARQIIVGTSAAAHVVSIGVNNGASSLSLNAGTGNLQAISGGTATIDAAGVVELNSTSGAISVGNDANTGAINIGTGAAARTITIGNTTGATDLDLRCGTGAFTLASATGTIMNALDTGEITYPLQPAFLGILATGDSNVTGAEATYTLGSGNALTEIFDRNSDFNTNGTFTAPVTGIYSFSTIIRSSGLTAAMTAGFLQLSTSNRSYNFQFLNCAAARTIAIAANIFVWNGSISCDMDAGDTATSTLTIGGGAGNTADIDAVGSFFSGYLIE